MKDQSATKKLLALFNRTERRNAVILLMLSIAAALAQALGVFSIFPFIDIIVNPSVIQDNSVYAFVYDFFGFRSTNRFLVFIGSVVFLVMVGSNTLNALNIWYKTKFVYNRNHALSQRLLKVYLGRDYEFFLGRNTSELSKNILAEVNELTQKYLMALFEIIINGLILVFIIITILIIEPLVTGVVILVFGTVYVVVYRYIRIALKKRGAQRLVVNRERFRLANEALSSIKTTKVLGVEDFFLYRYSQNSQLFARYNAYSKIAGTLPKFVIEGVAFGGLVLFVVAQLWFGRDILGIIPIVALLALAGYRMLPAVQKVFTSASQIYYSRPILDKIYEDTFDLKYQEKDRKRDKDPLLLEKSIVIKDLSFSYDDEKKKYVLDKVNLTIDKGQMIGFAGPSGSGKTTLVDIIMGLLKPTSGEIIIDDRVLGRDNIKSWQANIGYVPQDIYLSDDTIANNIAFGMGNDDVDLERVKKAAQLAALDTFIETELSEKYDTVVGERGVRLSGGQRQRIGLARALYKDPKVLVLDEATSALDNETEKAVLQAIEAAAKDRTVIMIAHRLTTLDNCDVIYTVNKGKITVKKD